MAESAASAKRVPKWLRVAWVLFTMPFRWMLYAGVQLGPIGITVLLAMALISVVWLLDGWPLFASRHEFAAEHPSLETGMGWVTLLTSAIVTCYTIVFACMTTWRKHIQDA